MQCLKLVEIASFYISLYYEFQTHSLTYRQYIIGFAHLLLQQEEPGAFGLHFIQ